MRVSDLEAVGLVTGDDGVVAFNSDFLNGIDDLGAGGELVKIGERAGPVVADAEDQGLAGIAAVGQQLDGNVAGTDAVLIVVVLPGLADGDGSLLGSVSVGHVEAAVLGGIAVNDCFGDGVVDQVATVFVLGQVGEGPGPTICCGDGDGVDDLAALEQVDGDGVGTSAILIVIVVPGLVAGNDDGCGRVRVSDLEAVGLVTGDDGVVAFNSDFLNGIDDLGAGGELVKIGERAGPVVADAEDQGLAGIAAVGQQLHGDIIGTLAILIVGVVPNLGDRDRGLGNFMGVGDDVAVVSGGVTVNSDFFDGVIDGLAVLVDFQTAEGSLPAIGLGEGSGGDINAVGQQLHGDRLGADAVLVVVVVPDLGDFDVLLVDIVGVGDHKSGVGAAVGRSVVGEDISLNYSVGDLAGTGVHMHIGPGVGPIVAIVQDDRIAVGLIVGQKLNCNRVRADTILIISVGPDLGDGNAGAGEGSVYAGNGECVLHTADIQISRQIGGVVGAFFKAVKQRIEDDTVGDGVDVGSGKTIIGGDDLGILQFPGEGNTVLGSEVRRQAVIDNIKAFVDRFIGSPTIAGHTTGDGFGNGFKSVQQLLGVVRVVSGGCGRSNAAGQERADRGAAAVGHFIGDTEADGVQLSALFLDLGGACRGGCVVLCATNVTFAGSTAVVAHPVSGNAVGQQDHIGVGNALNGIRVQKGACLIQTAFQIGTAVGGQIADNGKCFVVAVLAFAAGHIDPIQSGLISGGEGGDGQLMIQGVIGAGIGFQELLGSGLGSSHAALCVGDKIPISVIVRTGTVMEVLIAAISTVVHRVGEVDDQNHGCGNSLQGHDRAGFHLQGDLKGVALNMGRSL